MKHGRGKYTKKAKEKEDAEDEEPIFAPFENDKLNGLGVQGGKTILFKEGMAVKLEGDTITCKKFCQGFCSLLSCVLFYAMMAPHFAFGFPFPPIVVLQLIILIVYNILSTKTDAG